ncbi:MAG: FkbM family methyltransferase [Planctomycetes bacterium]|nr:FkbM family methyltransferase [Planctomycetota bacterium]
MSQWMSTNSAELEALRKRLETVEWHIRQMRTYSVRTQRHAYMAAAAERIRDRGQTPRRAPEFRSQYGEDLLLYDLFEGKPEGFFIEAGAFNGVDFSATYAFEQIGWSGLLVEPIPERAEQCRSNRPFSRVVHAALGSPGDPPTVTLESTQDQFGGMFSYVNTGSTHHNSMSTSGVPITSVKVPQVTLDSLLDSHQGPIDLVILDVEDNELRVLAGFDMSRYRPRVFLVEDGSIGKNQPLHAALMRHQYTLMGWMGVNAIYIHNGEDALRRRFADLLRA